MAENKIRALVRCPGCEKFHELECDVVLGINTPEKGVPNVVTIGQYDDALVILKNGNNFSACVPHAWPIEVIRRLAGVLIAQAEEKENEKELDAG